MDNAIVLALLAIVATVVGGMFKLLDANTKALTKLPESSEQVAKETATSNQEAKQRNGHLGEQNNQITELITRQNGDIVAIREAGEANVRATQKAVEVLEQTARTLADTTKTLALGTATVAETLKKNSVKEQTIQEQN